MENTAKNFALQLGSLISMYVSVTALGILLFAIITMMYPDAANGDWEYESASSSLRTGIALLIVFFPTYILLTRMVNTIRRTERGTYLTLTKWLIYLSLIIGGAIILGDFVAIINAFLDGELTIRFFLKALSLLVVVGLSFTYYLYDAREYWEHHETESIRYALGVSAIVLATLIGGFIINTTPSESREQKLDNDQATKFFEIDYQIDSYYALYGKLPTSLNEAYGSMTVPQATEERSPFEYREVEPTIYEICAEFAHEPKRHDALYIQKNDTIWCYKKNVDIKI